MKEIVITIVDQEKIDGIVIPFSKIFRYEFEGNQVEKDIIELLETHSNIISGGPMCN